MSGFLNVVGFGGGSGFAGFMSLLQNAMWRGVPFHVTGAVTHKGRKQAVHEYPFRDGGWVEDMGRAQRIFEFTGYLIGDLAPAMQLTLDAACEAPGPGLLMHPTLGAQQVSLISAASSVRKEQMRVIEVHFVFREQGSRSFPAALTGTAISVIGAAGSSLGGAAASLGIAAGGLALSGALPTALAGALPMVSGFASQALSIAGNPAGLLGMASGLVPDLGSTFGRFANGAVSSILPIGTTIGSLQGSISSGLAGIGGAGQAALSQASTMVASAAPAMMSSLSNVTEGLRGVMTDPASQIRGLLPLARFGAP